MTKQVFVVGSGRSASYSLFKALQKIPNVEVHHEYCCVQVQKIGCLYHAEKYSKDEAILELRDIYQSGVIYSSKEFFIDVSNKISWLVSPLLELFPKSKFVWLIRDPRKVCLSYYHKLAAEHYDDEAVEVLADYLSFPAEFRPPPLEKRWWWPVPRDVSERSEFVRWDRWRRVCWYFNEVCRELKENMTATRMRVFRLEDMTKSPSEFLKMTVRMGLEDASPADMEMAWQTFRKPSNVHVPVNYQMTPDQEAVYRELCGEVHEWLGYGWEPVEDVKYDN